MIKSTILFLLLLHAFRGTSQTVEFRVTFSEPFAVYEFIKSVSMKSPENIYKRLFTHSAFHTQAYMALIDRFDSLDISYVYDFTDYPAGQKVGIDVPDLLRRNLILCDNMQDFKIRSMGLVPNEKLFRLIDLISAFQPVYDSLIYEPCREKFTGQLQGISDLIRASNVQYYFTEAMQFYHASWDYSIPFIFCFYPLPQSRGFTATAISNVAISAMADTLDNYKVLLSVMLHEVSHILYDERSLALWNELDDWFASNPSKGSRYANSLFNEAMATAVGNGFLAAQLNGKEDTTRRWYGVKYISMMAKTAYPLVKSYITFRRPIDREFVDQYLQIFNDHFSGWLTELEFLMRGRVLVTDAPADIDLVDHLYGYTQGNSDFSGITEETLKKVRLVPATKLIVVNRGNRGQLELIRHYFPTLTAWQPDAGRDFGRCFFLPDKTWLIILNNVKGAKVDKLKNLAVRQTE